MQEDLDTILRSTHELWEEMRHQRLFITGGTGFFGCWLLESFLAANREFGLHASATVLTRDPESFAKRAPHLAGDAAITLLRGEITSFQPPEGEFSFVIHAAADVAAVDAGSHPLSRFSTLLEGTERMLTFAASHGTRKFLFTSSGAVYGRQPDDIVRIPEDFAGAPDTLRSSSAYGEGKRASELMCALYAENHAFQIKIARCFAFLGPWLPLDANFAAGNFIRDILAGRDIYIKGDGTPTRSYLYAGELATWLWTILFRAPAMVAFNVGSEEEVSIAEMARRVAASLDPKRSVTIAKAAGPNAAHLRYVPSTEKARQMLGLQQTVTLEESIRRTAAWHGFTLPLK